MTSPLHGHLVHDCINLFKDLRVRKANHFDTELREAAAALTIVGEAVGAEVGVPVDLDCELGAGRAKVDNERVDAVLPAELHAELLSSQVLPECAFCLGGVVPKRASLLVLTSPIVVERHQPPLAPPW